MFSLPIYSLPSLIHTTGSSVMTASTLTNGSTGVSGTTAAVTACTGVCGCLCAFDVVLCGFDVVVVQECLLLVWMVV